MHASLTSSRGKLELSVGSEGTACALVDASYYADDFFRAGLPVLHCDDESAPNLLAALARLICSV